MERGKAQNLHSAPGNEGTSNVSCSGWLGSRGSLPDRSDKRAKGKGRNIKKERPGEKGSLGSSELAQSIPELEVHREGAKCELSATQYTCVRIILAAWEVAGMGYFVTVSRP